MVYRKQTISLILCRSILPYRSLKKNTKNTIIARIQIIKSCRILWKFTSCILINGTICSFWNRSLAVIRKINNRNRLKDIENRCLFFASWRSREWNYDWRTCLALKFYIELIIWNKKWIMRISQNVDSRCYLHWQKISCNITMNNGNKRRK